MGRKKQAKNSHEAPKEAPIAQETKKEDAKLAEEVLATQESEVSKPDPKAAKAPESKIPEEVRKPIEETKAPSPVKKEEVPAKKDSSPVKKEATPAKETLPQEKPKVEEKKEAPKPATPASAK